MPETKKMLQKSRLDKSERSVWLPTLEVCSCPLQSCKAGVQRVTILVPSAAVHPWGIFSGWERKKMACLLGPILPRPLESRVLRWFCPCWEHDGGGRHGGSLWPFREGTARCGQTGPVPFVGVVKKIPGGKWTPDLEVCVWGSGAAMFM